MKNLRLLTVFMIAAFAMSTVSTAFAGAKKEKKTCTIEVEMDCGSCKKKIEDNFRFEKGVSKFDVSLEKQTVVVTYRADKTTPEKLVKALKDMGYKANIKGKKCDHKHGKDCNHKHSGEHKHDHGSCKGHKH